VGDVFLIEKGQSLYVTVRGDEQHVAAGEPTEHQEYSDETLVVNGKTFKCQDLITVQHVIPPVGEYVVLATEYSGGSRGGGMNGHDDYPDGHKVTAKPVKGRGPKVRFWQTGCFNAMIENPTVVRKAGAKA